MQCSYRSRFIKSGLSLIPRVFLSLCHVMELSAATRQRKTLKIHLRSQPFCVYPFSASSCLKWNRTEREHWFKSGLEETNRAVLCQGVCLYGVRICHLVFRQNLSTASDPYLCVFGACACVCVCVCVSFTLRVQCACSVATGTV